MVDKGSSENEEIELVFEIPSNTETDGDKPGEFVCNRNLETFDKLHLVF